MTIQFNKTDKIGIVSGTLTGFYLATWANLTILDTLADHTETFADLTNNQTNQLIALTGTVIVPLFMLTGAYFGLNLSARATLPKHERDYILSEKRQQFFGFFGIPDILGNNQTANAEQSHVYGYGTKKDV